MTPAGPATGPQPAPDPRLWADPTRRRVLSALAGHEQPVSIAELAKEIGGHPNTTRAHLDTLRLAGLVAREADSSGGRGRPSWLHVLTDLGRSAARRAEDEDPDTPPAGLDDLGRAFVTHLATTPGMEGMAREVGRSWGAAAGAPLESGTTEELRRAVVDLFDRMGFTPVVDEATAPAEDAPAAGDGAGCGCGHAEEATDVIVLRTCPLLGLAQEHPEVVCDVHLGLVTGLLDQAGAGPDRVRARLDPWGRPDGCQLVLTWGEGMGSPTCEGSVAGGAGSGQAPEAPLQDLA